MADRLGRNSSVLLVVLVLVVPEARQAAAAAAPARGDEADTDALDAHAAQRTPVPRREGRTHRREHRHAVCAARVLIMILLLLLLVLALILAWAAAAVAARAAGAVAREPRNGACALLALPARRVGARVVRRRREDRVEFELRGRQRARHSSLLL